MFKILIILLYNLHKLTLITIKEIFKKKKELKILADFFMSIICILHSKIHYWQFIR